MIEPLSGAVAILSGVAKVAPGAAKLGYDFLNPKVGVLPKVRADAVDSLNATLAPERTRWTPEKLFLFFAAFTITEPLADSEGLSVIWTCSEHEIVDLLTRGVELERKERMIAILHAAMQEVPDMIGLLPKPKKQMSFSDATTAKTSKIRAEFADASMAKKVLMACTVTNRLLGVPSISGMVVDIVAYQTELHRNEKLRIAILVAIGQSLAQAGLSTVETKRILMGQGLPEADALKAMQLS